VDSSEAQARKELADDHREKARAACRGDREREIWEHR
jgi:hypothetical protein